jgi:hypothetical protein
MTAIASRAPRPVVRDTDRLLAGAGTFFACAVLIHNADHVRRGAGAVRADVFWTGTAAIALEVLVVVLTMQRHRAAPVAAALAGPSLAAGYVVVHYLPARSWLSDSFTSAAHVSPLSWIAASLEVVAALTLGAAGLVALGARGGVSSARVPHAPQQRLARTLAHPVVVAVVAGNAVIVAISLAQRY